MQNELLSARQTYRKGHCMLTLWVIWGEVVVDNVTAAKIASYSVGECTHRGQISKVKLNWKQTEAVVDHSGHL